jgi:hypothetical protein
VTILDKISQIESLLSELRTALTEQVDVDPVQDKPPVNIVDPGVTVPVSGPIFGISGISERGGLVSNGATKLGLEYQNHGDESSQIIAVWTTEFGSWEPRGGDYDIPQWARDKYLSKMPLAGGDHHMYALTLAKDGSPIVGAQVHFTSRDGQAIDRVTNERGFVAQEVYGSSSFVPERGEHGAWSFAPDNGELVKGFGMPSKRHVSVFVVWKER